MRDDKRDKRGRWGRARNVRAHGRTQETISDSCSTREHVRESVREHAPTWQCSCRINPHEVRCLRDYVAESHLGEFTCRVIAIRLEIGDEAEAPSLALGVRVRGEGSHIAKGRDFGRIGACAQWDREWLPIS